MKPALLFFAILVVLGVTPAFAQSSQYLQPSLSQRLDAVVIAANKAQLNSAELAALERSFAFPADHAVFDLIKKRKRLFSSPDMSMSRKYNSLFISRGGELVIEMDFHSDGQSVVINGSKLEFSRESALTPQVQAFLKNRKATSASHNWREWFWPEAEAQVAQTPQTTEPLSDEVQAIVTGVLAASQPFLMGQFAVSHPQINTSSVLSMFNQTQVTKVSPLTCLKDVSTGTVDVKVDQDQFKVGFAASSRNDRIYVEFKVGEAPRPFRAVLSSERTTFRKVACMHINAANGVRVALETVDAPLRNRFIAFENFLPQLTHLPPTNHPIFKACASPEKKMPLNSMADLEKCIKFVCSGAVTALDFAIKFENFDLAMVPALKTPTEEFKKVQAELAASLARIPKGELTAENSPRCETPSDLAFCSPAPALLTKYPDLANRFAVFSKRLALYQIEIKDYMTGLNDAVYIANAAHMCCLDSPECPAYYNEKVVPAAAAGKPAPARQ